MRIPDVDTFLQHTIPYTNPNTFPDKEPIDMKLWRRVNVLIAGMCYGMKHLDYMTDSFSEAVPGTEYYALEIEQLRAIRRNCERRMNWFAQDASQ